MKKRINHIIYRTLGTLLMVFTVVQAMAQKPVSYFQVDQCETLEFSVVDWPGDRYTWDLYRDSTVNFAQTKGDVDPVAYFDDNGNPPRYYEGSTVRINWLEPGRYFLRVIVWDEVNCTNNLLLFLVDVLANPPEATLEGDSVCYGEPVVIKIVLSGMGPWDVKYSYGDGSAVVNLIGVTESERTIPITQPLPIGETKFWIMEVTDGCSVNSYEADPKKIGVIIYPKPKNSKIYLKE